MEDKLKKAKQQLADTMTAINREKQIHEALCKDNSTFKKEVKKNEKCLEVIKDDLSKHGIMLKEHKALASKNKGKLDDINSELSQAESILEERNSAINLVNKNIEKQEEKLKNKKEETIKKIEKIKQNAVNEILK